MSYIRTAYHRALTRNINLGKSPSQSTRDKLRAAFKGRKLPATTRLRMSLAKRGIAPKNFSQIAGWNRGHKGYLAGEKNYFWKGGISTPERKIYLNIENLQPLCGPCNSAKGVKIIDYRV